MEHQKPSNPGSLLQEKFLADLPDHHLLCIRCVFEYYSLSERGALANSSSGKTHQWQLEYSTSCQQCSVETCEEDELPIFVIGSAMRAISGVCSPCGS